MDDPVVTLLRTTFDDLVADLDEVPDGEWAPPPAAPARRGPWRALSAAACVVLVGVATIAVASRGGESEGETGLGTGSVVAPTNDTQWFLPTWLPDGYEVTGLAASTDVLDAPLSYEVWMRKDGRRTTGYIGVVTDPPLPPANVTAPSGIATTVHGEPAVITTRVYDVPERAEHVVWLIRWSEGETRFEITTVGLGKELTRWVAEGTVVVDGVLTIADGTAPAGFELVDRRSDPAGTEFDGVLISVASSQPSASGPIFTTAFSRDGTLDAYVDRESERLTVDGMEISILREALGTPLARVTAQWVRDGYLFRAFGSVAEDEMLQFARGVRPATPDEATAMVHDALETALALPVHASATVEDGLTATLRIGAGTGRHRLGALCLQAAEPSCSRFYLDEQHSQTAAGSGRVFEVSGHRRVVVWTDVDPGDVTSSDGESVQVIDGDVGWFVVLDLPAGGDVPTLTSDRGLLFIVDRPWP